MVSFVSCIHAYEAVGEISPSSDYVNCNNVKQPFITIPVLTRERKKMHRERKQGVELPYHHLPNGDLISVICK